MWLGSTVEVSRDWGKKKKKNWLPILTANCSVWKFPLTSDNFPCLTFLAETPRTGDVFTDLLVPSHLGIWGRGMQIHNLTVWWRCQGNWLTVCSTSWTFAFSSTGDIAVKGRGRLSKPFRIRGPTDMTQPFRVKYRASTSPQKKKQKTSLGSHEKWHLPKERLLRRQIWHLKSFLPTEK